MTSAFVRSKTCSKCGQEKSTEDFPPRKGSRDGLHGWCRPCFRAYYGAKGREWRAKNPERQRENNRKQYAANPERGRRRAQEWRERNREATREAARRYYWENQEEQLEKARQYREEHRAEINRRRREHHAAHPAVFRLRARRRYEAVRGGVDPETAEFANGLLARPCAYCGSTERIEIDHIVPLSRGGAHSIDNLAPACLPCNRSKGAKLLEEWLGDGA